MAAKKSDLGNERVEFSWDRPLEACGNWNCPFEQSGDESLESKGEKCIVCYRKVPARAFLKCPLCTKSTCTLCQIRILEFRGFSDASCSNCRITLSPTACNQLLTFYMGHTQDLPANFENLGSWKERFNRIFDTHAEAIAADDELKKQVETMCIETVQTCEKAARIHDELRSDENCRRHVEKMKWVGKQIREKSRKFREISMELRLVKKALATASTETESENESRKQMEDTKNQLEIHLSKLEELLKKMGAVALEPLGMAENVADENREPDEPLDERVDRVPEFHDPEPEVEIEDVVAVPETDGHEDEREISRPEGNVEFSWNKPLEACGNWKCPFEQSGSEPLMEVRGECTVCYEQVPARGLLKCPACKNSTCVLCEIQILAHFGFSTASCSKCQKKRNAVASSQLLTFYLGHKNQLPSNLEHLEQWLDERIKSLVHVAEASPWFVSMEEDEIVREELKTILDDLKLIRKEVNDIKRILEEAKSRRPERITICEEQMDRRVKCFQERCQKLQGIHAQLETFREEIAVTVSKIESAVGLESDEEKTRQREDLKSQLQIQLSRMEEALKIMDTVVWGMDKSAASPETGVDDERDSPQINSVG